MILLDRLLRNPSAIVIANTGTQSLIRFVSNVVLARLLMPTAFALTSITMLIIGGIQMVSDVGIAVVALRNGPMGEVERTRMWTMQLARGIALSIVLLALAKPAAALFQAPELARVLMVLSIVPTIQGAQSLFPILALARQDLMPTFWVDVVGRVVGSASSILIAVFYPTVWALVIGILIQVIFSTLISHGLSKQRWPKFDFNIAYIRSHWQFSRWIQLGSTMTFVASQIDKAVFPLLFGIARFGVYGIGANFALIPSQITQKWSASIFYPLMVKNIRGDELAKAQLTKVRVTMLLYSAVIVLGMMCVSPSFFYLLYKPNYQEAARFAVLLASASYFEVAESSLRHYPLVDKTARYEFIAVIVRLSAFALSVSAIWFFGAEAELYALSFTAAQAASCLFMLCICIRAGYVTGETDLALMIIICSAVFLAYAIPMSPASLLASVLEGGAVGSLTAILLFVIFLKRGLPSLPHAVSGDVLVKTAQAENHASV